MRHLFLALPALLAGCATVDVVKVSESQRASLEGQPLTVVYHPQPSFTASNAGKVAAGSLFGAIGGAIAGASMNSAGNEIVATYSVQDPAAAIASRLGPAYGSHLRASVTQSASAPSSDEPAQLSQQAGGTGAVFDVRTLSWMFQYFPTNWTHYRVVYAARARLIDARSGQVIGQAPCNYQSNDEAGAPTYDELLANNAAILKAALAKAAENCANEFERAMFDGRVAGQASAPKAVATSVPVSTVAATMPVVPPAAAAAPTRMSLSPGDAHAAQSIVVRQRPQPQATVAMAVPAGASLRLQVRQLNGDGAWWFVDYQGTSGWVSENSLVQ